MEDLLKTLRMRPEHDKERAAEKSDIDYTVTSTLKMMSQVPQNMSGNQSWGHQHFIL